MSWAADEWKDGLPAKALQKINQLETQFERLKKEREQKQYQLDSLEQALQVQKRKVEDERNQVASVKRENQSLLESCEEAEKKRHKLLQDIHTKDNHISCLEGQLSHTKSNLGTESTKVGSLQTEVEKLQHECQEAEKKLEKLTTDYGKVQELSSQQRVQLDNKTERIHHLEVDLKKAQDGLDMKSNIANNVSLGGEVATLKEKLKALETQKINGIEEHRKEHKKLEDELSKMRELLSSMEKEKEKLEKEKKELSDTVFRMENSKKSSDSNMTEVKNKADIAEKEKMECSKELEAKEKICVDFENRIKQMQQDIGQHEQQNSNLKAKLMDRDLEVESLKAKCEQISSKIEKDLPRLEKCCKDLQSDKESMIDMANKSKLETDQLNEKLKEMSNSLSSNQNVLEKKEADFIKICKELDELKKTKESLQEILDKEKEHCAKIGRELNERHDQVKNLETILENKDKKITVISEQLQSNEGKLQNLEQQLRNETTALKDKCKETSDNNQCLQSTLEKKVSELGKFMLDYKNLSEKCDGLQSMLDKEKQLEENLNRTLFERNDEIKDLRGQLDKKELDIIGLSSQCQDFERKIQNNSQLLEAKEKELGEVKNLLKESEEKIDACEKTFEQKLKEKQCDLNQNQQQAENFQKDLDKTISELHHLEEKLSNLSAEKENLEKVLQMKNDENDQYLKKVDNLNIEMQKLSSASDSKLKSVYEEKDNKIKHLEETLAKKSDELHGKFEEIKELMGNLTKAQEFGSELSSNNNTLNQQIKELENEIQKTVKSKHNVEEEHQSMVNEMKGLKDKHHIEIQNLTTKLGSLEQKLEGMKGEYQQACGLADSKAAEIRELTDELVVQQKNMEQLQHRTQLAEQGLKQAEDSYSCLLLEKTKLEESMGEKCEELQTTSKELKCLKETVSEKDHNMKDMTSNSEENERVFADKIKTTEAELSTLSEKYATMEMEYNNLKTEHDQLVCQSQDHTKLMTMKEEEITHLKEKLTTYETEIDMMQKECFQGKDEQTDLQTQFSALNEQYNSNLNNLRIMEEKLMLTSSELQQLQEKFDVECQKSSDKINLLQNECDDFSEKLKQANATVVTKNTEIESLRQEMHSLKNSSADGYDKMDKDLSGMTDTVDKLTIDKNRSHEMLEIKEGELSCLQAKYEELQETFNVLTSKNTDLTENLTSLQNDHQALQHRFQQSSEAISMKSVEIEKLQDCFVSKEQQAGVSFENLQGEIDQLKTQVELFTVEKEKSLDLLSAKENEIGSLQSELSEVKETNCKLQAKLDMIQMDIEDKEECMSSLDENVKHLQESLEKLKQSSDEKTNALESTHSEMISALGRLKEAEHEKIVYSNLIQEQKLKIEQQNTAISELRSVMEGQATSATSLSDDAEKLKIELTEKCASLIKNEQMITELNISISDLHKILEEYKEKLEEKSASFSDLQSTCSGLQEQLDNINSSFKQHLDQSENHQQQHAELEKTLSQVREALAKKEIEYNNLNGRHSEALEKLETAQAVVNRNEEAIERYTSSIHVLEDKVRLLESGNHELKSTTDKELHNLIVDVEYKEKNVDAISSKLTDAQNSINKLEARIQKYKVEIQEKEINITDLNTKCESLQNNFDEMQELYNNREAELNTLKSSAVSLETKMMEIGTSSNANQSTSKQMINDLNSRLEDMNMSSEEKDRTIQELNMKVVNLTQNINDMRIVLEEKQAENTQTVNEVGQQMEKLNQELNEKTDLVETLRNTTENLQLQLEEKRVILKSRTDAMSVDDVNMKEMEVTLVSLQGERTQLLELKGQLENENNVHSSKISSLESIIEEKDSRIVSFESTIEGMASRINDLEQSLSSVEESSNNQQKICGEELHKKNKCVQELEQTISNLELTVLERDSVIKTLTADSDEANSELVQKLGSVQSELHRMESTKLQLEDLLKAAEGREIQLKQEMSHATAETEKLKLGIIENEESFKICKSDLEISISKQSEQIDSLQDVICDLRKKTSEKEEEILILSKTLEDKDEIFSNEITSLKNENQKLEAEMSNYRMKIESLSDYLASATEEKDRLDRDIVDLEMAKNVVIQELKASLENEQMKLQSFEKQNTLDLGILKTSSESTQIQFKTLLDDANVQKNMLQNELENTREKLFKLEEVSHLTEHNQKCKITELTTENNCLNKLNEERDKELEKLQGQLAEHQEKLSDLEHQLTSLKLEKSELGLQISNLRATEVEMKLCLEESVEKNTVHADLLSNKKEELNDIQKQTEQNILKRDSMITELTAEVDSLRSQTAELENTVSLKENEKENLLARNSQLQEKVDSLLAIKCDFEEQTGKYVEDNDNLNVLISKKDSEYESLETKFRSIQTDFEFLSEKHDQASKNWESEKIQITSEKVDLQNTVEIKNDEIKQLQMNLEALHRTLVESHNTIETLKSKSLEIDMSEKIAQNQVVEMDHVHTAEIERLKLDNKILQEKLESTEEKFSTIVLMKEKADSDLVENFQNLKSLSDDLDSLKMAKDEKDQEVIGLEQEINNLTKQRDMNDQELQEIKLDMATLKTELEEAILLQESLMKSVENSQNKQTSAESELAEARDMILKLQTSCKTNVEDTGHQLNQLKSDIECLNMEIKEKECRVSALESEKERFLSIISQQEEDNRSLTVEKLTVEHAFSDTQTELQSTQCFSQSIRQQLQESDAGFQELKQQVEDLKSENDNLLEKIQNLRVEKGTLENNLEETVSENSEHNKRCGILEDKLEDCQLKLEKSEELVKNHTLELHNLSSKLENSAHLQIEIESLQNELSTYKDIKQTSEYEVKELKNRNMEMQNEIDSLMLKSAELESMCSDKSVELDNLTAERNDIEKESQEISLEYSRVLHDLKHMQGESDSKKVTIENLEDKIREFEQAVANSSLEKGELENQLKMKDLTIEALHKQMKEFENQQTLDIYEKESYVFEISELKIANTNMTEKFSEIEKDNIEVKNLSNQLKDAVKLLESERNKKNNKLKELEETLEVCRIESSDWQSQVSQKEATINELTTKVNSLVKDNKALQSDVESFKDVMESLEEENSALESEKKNFESEMQTCRKESIDNEAKLLIAEKILRKLEEEKETLLEKSEEKLKNVSCNFNEQIESLNAEIMELQEKYMKICKKENSLKDEICEFKKCITNLENLNIEAEKSSSLLNDKVNELESEVRSLAADKLQLQKRTTMQEKEKNELLNQFLSLEDQKAVLTRSLAGVELEVKDAKKECERILQDLNDAKRQISQLEKQKTEKQRMIMDLSSDIQTLKLEKSSLQDKNLKSSKHLQELEESKQKVMELESRIQNLNFDQDTLREKLRKSSEKENLAEKNRMELSKELQESKSRSMDIQRKFDALSEANGTMKVKLEDVEAQLEELIKEPKQEAKLVELQSELKDLLEQIEKDKEVMKKWESRCSQLTSQLTSERAVVARYKTQLDKQKTNDEVDSTKLKEMEEKVKRSEEQIQEYSNKYYESEKQCREKSRECEGLRTKLRGMNQLMREMKDFKTIPKKCDTIQKNNETNEHNQEITVAKSVIALRTETMQETSNSVSTSRNGSPQKSLREANLKFSHSPKTLPPKEITNSAKKFHSPGGKLSLRNSPARNKSPAPKLALTRRELPTRTAKRLSNASELQQPPLSVMSDTVKKMDDVAKSKLSNLIPPKRKINNEESCSDNKRSRGNLAQPSSSLVKPVPIIKPQPMPKSDEKLKAIGNFVLEAASTSSKEGNSKLPRTNMRSTSNLSGLPKASGLPKRGIPTYGKKPLDTITNSPSKKPREEEPVKRTNFPLRSLSLKKSPDLKGARKTRSQVQQDEDKAAECKQQ